MASCWVYLNSDTYIWRMKQLLPHFDQAPSSLQLQCMKWLEAEQLMYGAGDAVLFQILRSGCFGSTANETDRFLLQYNEKKRGQKKTSLSLRKMIADAVPRDLFSSLHADPIAKASEWLEKAILLVKGEKWAELGTNLRNLTATNTSFEILPFAELKPLLDKYTLSVSGLNSFLECPRSFYFETLLRIPVIKHPSMLFGSAVHYALEKLFTQMKQQQGRFDSEEQFVQWFEEYMQGNRVAFDTDFDARIQKGRDILPLYYRKYLPEWSRVVIVEKLIRGVNFRNVPLLGFIDKLEFNGTDVSIIDYKTGSIEKAMIRLEPPSAHNTMGGSYWRQAIFYKILVDHNPGTAWRAKEALFEFIEPVDGQFIKKRIELDPASIETVAQQIAHSWERIQNGDFLHKCTDLACPYCQTTD